MRRAAATALLRPVGHRLRHRHLRRTLPRPERRHLVVAERRRIDPEGTLWSSVLASTGQPKDMR
jgi:hypothetical protein